MMSDRYKIMGRYELSEYLNRKYDDLKIIFTQRITDMIRMNSCQEIELFENNHCVLTGYCGSVTEVEYKKLRLEKDTDELIVDYIEDDGVDVSEKHGYFYNLDIDEMMYIVEAL